MTGEVRRVAVLGAGSWGTAFAKVLGGLTATSMAKELISRAPRPE
ncbi:MAG: hypothetical protein ACT4RN_07965 [Pseudonocardia sp.]